MAINKQGKKIKIPTTFEDRHDLKKFLKENEVDRRDPEAQAAFKKLRKDHDKKKKETTE